MKIKKYYWLVLGIVFSVIFSGSLRDCLAMPPGALLYRTSADGKMFGYSGDSLTETEKGVLKTISSGHVAIYIGQENGIDYVVEALPDGVVKKPASQFVNAAAGEKYLGAKIPRNLTAVQQAKAVAIAKNLASSNLAYDFDFKNQKGPNSGEWTCVGLTEKIYESANISNPSNLQALEYDQNYYAIDITADGLDSYSVVSNNGDCFSRSWEFSKIARRTDILFPAPELIGFNLGYEKDGTRYLFLPYTQFLQAELKDIPTDINVASSFNDADVRGSVNSLSLALRWSLINNPISSLKTIASRIGNLTTDITRKLFAASEEEMNIVLTDVVESVSPELAGLAKTVAVINKSTGVAATTSASSTKEVVVPRNDNGAIDVDAYYSQSDEPIMTLITKAIQAGLEDALTTGKSSGVSASWASASSSEDGGTSDNNVSAAALTTAENTETITSASLEQIPSSAAVAELEINSQIPKVATINRIYSTGDNDFIELYNPSDIDFDLATEKYRLERAKTAEDPSLVLRFGNLDDATYPGGTIIKARDTYLIVKNTASAYFLDQADAIAKRSEFSWPDNGYTIYLGTGAISSSQDPDIIEAVGFGNKATYFQGNGPAPAIQDNYILKRIHDYKHNNLDFALVKSGDPSIDWNAINNAANGNATETETTNTNNSNVNINVNVNTATSTSSTATTTTATTTSVVVATTTATTTINIATSTVATSTATSTTATTPDTTTASTTPAATTSPPVGRAIINKIHSTGDTDWIELHNPSDYPVDLAALDYRLEKAKTAEDPALIMRLGTSSDGLYPGGTIIAPHSNYLIVSSDSNDYYLSRAQAIATRTEFSWFNSGYTFYLATSSVSSSTDPDIIDLVGVGPDATYWQGAAPTLALKDNYTLSRVGTSGNNNLDFNLVKSDNPNVDWGSEPVVESSSNAIYTFANNSYDLFPQPEPVTSPGLVYLWHFDECWGESAAPAISNTTLSVTPHWSVGKFGCAKNNGYDYGSSSATLETPIDLNNFSISFWFKQATPYPRLSLSLTNQNNDYVNLTLEEGLVQVDGLATPSWRNFMSFPFDDTWRQATLVVNRQKGYWSLYIDGEPIYSIETYKLLPAMDYISFAGDNGSYRLDELAIWNRALTTEEIVYLRGAEQAFAPLTIPVPQEKAVLKHFWNFNEGIDTSAQDLIGGATMTVGKDNWLNLDLVNSALITQFGENINVNFPEIRSPDLSLTYKWRSHDLSNDNRVKVSLRNAFTTNIFSLISSVYISAYYFNGGHDYFSYGQDLTIPFDTNWHDLALVYDSYCYKLKYYVDGNLVREVEHIWPPGREFVSNLEFLPENWYAEIDDLGIWEGALSAQQIQAISASN